MRCEGEGGEGDSDIGIQLSQSRHTRLSSAGKMNKFMTQYCIYIIIQTVYTTFLMIFLCGQDT